MKIVALMKVRNEQWVLRASLPAALMVADEVVILDHGSTDRTGQIIRDVTRRHPGRIHELTQDDPTWTEAGIMQRLLEVGRERQGTHFAIIDADEMLSGNLLPRVRQFLSTLQPGRALWLPWLAMWRSLDQFRDDDSIWSNNPNLFAFADSPALSFTAHDGGYDIHTRWPRGLANEDIWHKKGPFSTQAGGGVMHLQFANWRRLVAKHAWYKMVEVVRWPGRSTPPQINEQYNRALDESRLALADVGPDWWKPYAALRDHITMNDVPWQEVECKRLLQEHGAAKFAGLELWGIPGAAPDRAAA